MRREKGPSCSNSSLRTSRYQTRIAVISKTPFFQTNTHYNTDTHPLMSFHSLTLLLILTSNSCYLVQVYPICRHSVPLVWGNIFTSHSCSVSVLLSLRSNGSISMREKDWSTFSSCALRNLAPSSWKYKLSTPLFTIIHINSYTVALYCFLPSCVMIFSQILLPGSCSGFAEILRVHPELCLCCQVS